MKCCNVYLLHVWCAISWNYTPNIKLPIKLHCPHPVRTTSSYLDHNNIKNSFSNKKPNPYFFPTNSKREV